MNNKKNVGSSNINIYESAPIFFTINLFFNKFMIMHNLKNLSKRYDTIWRNVNLGIDLTLKSYL